MDPLRTAEYKSTEECLKAFPRIRLTIGTKLVALIASLLMASVVGLVWSSTRLFVDYNTAFIQQTNAETAASLAAQMRELFENTTEKMRVLGTVLIQDLGQAEVKDRVVAEFFSKDKDFLALVVHKHGDDGATEVAQKTASPELAGLGDSDAEKALAALLADSNFSLTQVAKGEAQLTSIKLADGSPAVAIAIPFIQTAQQDRFSHTIAAFVRQSRFVKAFGESDIITAYMVDRRGRLLAHPDAARVSAGESVSHLDIVKLLLEGKFNNHQLRYMDSEWQLGAFRVVGFGGLGVVAQVPEAKAFEAAQKLKYRSILIALFILCISFFGGYLYSGTITWPIKQLVVAARQIAEGDFKINLKPKSRDEVATLSLAFNDMAKGLEERDRVKDTFNKFHNKEIAEKLLSGEVKLGGERREATIFFSDVRGFTGMSETMEPEQVVEMLNEYMTRMVAIIRAHNGIVDKYVGDAIMAIWGVPIEKPDDTLNAVKACLAMRADLSLLNELRMSRGQPVLKIGMGLNRGPVIAGNIGSTEKMEYTVIGDSVNTASRMESMTKEYGTDLLVPRKICDAVPDRFLFEQSKSAKVKGKTEALEVFKVKGYYDENGNPVIVETPYSSYAAEKSDKVVHEKAVEKHEKPATAAPMKTATVTAVPTPAAALVQQKWFIYLGDGAYGPFTSQEILTGIAAKDLDENTLVSPRNEGNPWMPLSRCPEFQSRFVPASPERVA